MAPVGAGDLLGLLTEFGTGCEDSVIGCTDPLSSNFNEDATQDDGSCSPYVGMIGLGGLVIDISNTQALVLNITEEVTVGPLEQAAIDAANSLNTNGYSDWDIPYPLELQDLCPVVQYVNLIINQNGGIPLDGRYVVDQCGANCTSPFAWLLALIIDSNGCGSSYADALEFGDTFKLRAVRRHPLDD